VIKIARVAVTAVVSMRRGAVPTVCVGGGEEEREVNNDGGADRRRSTREMSEERKSD
jgi:hypothetical protein